MATETDQRIFVCGVTQYAMSSGKFEADDILTLAERARDAFVAIWGQPTAEAPRQASPSPGASQRPWGAAAAPPPQVQPETKPFSMWGGDKAYFGKNDQTYAGMPVRDVDWATWLDCAARGDVDAKKALQIMANGKVGDDPKWQRQNAQKIARAKAVIEMLKRTPAQNDGGPPPDETTPF